MEISPVLIIVTIDTHVAIATGGLYLQNKETK